jgi:hypothetical protein
MSEIELRQRLEKLERDNRRLKRLGIVSLALVAGLVAIAATRPVPDKITAHEFDVVNDSGMVTARLGKDALDFYNEKNGRVTVRLLNASNSGGLIFYGEHDQKIGKYLFPVERVSLNYWGLFFDTEDGTDVITLGGIHVGGGSYATPTLLLRGGSPSVRLSDSQGFTMDLGATDTMIERTGQTQHTSAASIVMFGNDKKHHVIWQVP